MGSDYSNYGNQHTTVEAQHSQTLPRSSSKFY